MINFDELKDIIQKEGGKIIIVENDKPQMVIMSFDEWRGKKAAIKLNEAVKPNPMPQEREEEIPEGLTIDDLPL